MSELTTYTNFVTGFKNLLKEGKSLPLGKKSLIQKDHNPDNKNRVLLFSPHPDDEELMHSSLALRLLRENDMRVTNLAVTLGSNKDRQQARAEELKNACDFLGYDLNILGLERITPKTHIADPVYWQKCVVKTAKEIEEVNPDIVMIPHYQDWNGTHIGTCLLAIDALSFVGYEGYVVEGEFWHPIGTPNLMVEVDENYVAEIVTAISCHKGEVERNPYHLRWPAYLIDNVRRGGEVVGGQGGEVPDFTFAQLYRVGKLINTKFTLAYEGGRIISSKEDFNEIFEL